jgi:hypothetical protein
MKIKFIHGLCPVIGRNGETVEPARRRASIKTFEHLISPPWVKKAQPRRNFAACSQRHRQASTDFGMKRSG